MTGKNRHSAVDNGKSEDPAKMTYSIPDFVSRNTINNTQYLFQYLQSWDSILNIQYLLRLNSILWESLIHGTPPSHLTGPHPHAPRDPTLTPHGTAAGLRPWAPS